MEHTRMNHSPEMNSNNNYQPQEPRPEQNGERKQMGPMLGIVIILIIIVFGGLYFWGARLNDAKNDIDQIPLILGDDGSSITPSQTASDSPENIESDFDTTDIDALEAGIEGDLSNIEFELQ